MNDAVRVEEKGQGDDLDYRLIRKTDYGCLGGDYDTLIDWNFYSIIGYSNDCGISIDRLEGLRKFVVR